MVRVAVEVRGGPGKAALSVFSRALLSTPALCLGIQIGYAAISSFMAVAGVVARATMKNVAAARATIETIANYTACFASLLTFFVAAAGTTVAIVKAAVESVWPRLRMGILEVFSTAIGLLN